MIEHTGKSVIFVMMPLACVDDNSRPLQFERSHLLFRLPSRTITGPIFCENSTIFVSDCHIFPSLSIHRSTLSERPASQDLTSKTTTDLTAINEITEPSKQAQIKRI